MSSGGGSFIGNGATQVGNFVGDLTGSNATARAVGDAANAQLGQQRADRGLALQYAQPSPQELQQLQEAITLNTQDIARKQKLLDSADPALIEAGHQALSLMQGKGAAALDPIKNERGLQRQQLESTLAQRLGSDYASSSAGIQALNQFDQQTSNLMTNAQQSTLGQFLGVAQNTQSFGNQQQNIANSSALAGQYGNQGVRSMQAIFGSAIDPGQAYAGDISRLSANQQFQQQQFNQFANPASQSQKGEQFGSMIAGQVASGAGSAVGAMAMA